MRQRKAILKKRDIWINSSEEDITNLMF
jgi:hypothetical protein